MAKKNDKAEKALSKAADLILDLLAELPPAKARAARNEIRALALKSSRSLGRGRASQQRKSADLHLSRPARAKSA